jgi:LPXTG-motif cell wall-anchored protein
MNAVNIVAIVIAGLLGLSLIAFLIWKNKKDRLSMNPDAENLVEETVMDQKNRNDKI